MLSKPLNVRNTSAYLRTEALVIGKKAANDLSSTRVQQDSAMSTLKMIGLCPN